MSGRILRHVRITQTIPSPALPLPSRRCYAVAASGAQAQTRDTQWVSRPSKDEAQEWRTMQHDESIPNAQTSTSKLPETGSNIDSCAPALSASNADARSVVSKGVEEHLAMVTAAGMTPTMSDLAKLQPSKHSHPDSPKYPVDYNAIIDVLCRCFSKTQLRNFIYAWDCNSPLASIKRKKVQYAESIVEKMWGWPSLKDVERARRDRTEVSVKTFPVTASQMFLIMGKDGADLLELSRAFNVHISLNTDPFALRVEGVHASLSMVSERIESIKKSIIEEVIQLPTKAPIRPDMVQRISRLAGALLENIGKNGEVRICAKTQRSLEIAQRLVIRASHELQQDLTAARLAYQPSPTADSITPIALFPITYSLYPFLTPHPLPWTMNTGGAFRVRRVGSWLESDHGEDIEKTGGMAGGKGRLLSTGKEAVDPRSVMFQGLSGVPTKTTPSRRVIKALTGHVLLTTSSAGQRATLVPPLQGKHPLMKILDWMVSTDVRTSFVPSLPAPLVHTSPTTDKLVHRLVYHAVRSPSLSSSLPARVNRYLSFEVVLVGPQHTRAQSNPSSDNSAVDWKPGSTLDPLETKESTSPTVDFSPEYRMGSESVVDIMIPDRPLDMQLYAQDSTLITPGEEPPELGTYASQLQSFLKDECDDGRQPDPPVMFTFDGDTWIMHASATVRRSIEQVVLPTRSGQAGEFIKIVSESILELESNQKSMQCELVCEDPTSMESWNHFLSHCDTLTMATYQPISSALLVES